MQRMYLETMQEILSRTPAVVVDDRLKGLVPFLPLNLPAQAVPAPQPSAPTTAQSAQQPAGATR